MSEPAHRGRAEICAAVLVLSTIAAGGCREGTRKVEPSAPPAPLNPRVVIIGVEGLDPESLEREISTGRLPSLARLHRTRLPSSLPSDPLTAWTTALTGTSPSVHGVVGAAVRLPGTHVLTPRRGPPGAVPVWSILGAAGKRSRVIRAPMTFPPDRMQQGELLTGPETPDVLGGPCRWVLVDSAEAGAVPSTGLVARAVSTAEGKWESELVLTGAGGESLATKLRFESGTGEGAALRVDAGAGSASAALGEWSGFFRVEMQGDQGRMTALTRMLPLRADSRLRVLLEPLGVDPFAPSAPISSPRYYSGFLADRYGDYRTCGDGGDESAFDAGVMGPAALLRQLYSSMEHQERMTLGELARDGWDVIISVFAQPGAVAGIFGRGADPGMPAHDDALAGSFGDAREKMYGRVDLLTGQVIKALGPEDRLIVMSARGERTVRREFNINTWLVKEGYLVLVPRARGVKSASLADVDWTRTRAWAAGAGGIWLNVAGRDPEGVVEPGQSADDLASEIAQKLSRLAEGTRAVVSAVVAGNELRGEHGALVPDLVVVMAPGYSVSAATQAGAVPPAVIVDSTRPWIPGADGGDPDDAAGILMTLLTPTGEPTLLDVTPTVLDVLGVEKPASLSGSSFW